MMFAVIVGLSASVTLSIDNLVTENPVALRPMLQPAQVCEITNIIAVGVGGQEAPGLLLETVVHVETEDGAVWRAIHFPLDPSEGAAGQGGVNGFDLMEVAASSLSITYSEAHWGGLNAFDFGGDEVVHRFEDEAGIAMETIDLNSSRPIPEGPGTAILAQAVPWADGLRAHTQVLDRWRGKGRERLRSAVIEVTGTSAVEVGGTIVPVFEVQTRVGDMFKLEELVTRTKPHRVVRTTYYPTLDAEPIVSELISFMDGPDCP